MSWKFPKYEIEDGQTISADEVVENTLEIANEIGRLDENNWAQNFVSDRSTMAQGIAIVTHTATRGLGVSPNGGYNDSAAKLLSTESWESISGLTKTFGTSGGLVWILCSFQTTNSVANSGGGGTYTKDVGGALWAIRVDGRVIVESTLGSQELDNDATEKTGTFVPSAGVARWRIPLTTEAMVVLSEGQHTIELVGQALSGGSNVLAGLSADFPSTIVTLGQLIIVELLR